MATKNEIVEKQAEAIVNNALIDGLSRQITEKQKFGLSFPADYNPINALNGAYLTLQETKDKNGKCVLESCSQSSIAHTLMDMVTMGLSMQKKQCYPVAYGGKLQLMISYHGQKTMAHRYGAKDINAEVIYEGDSFKYHIENGQKVIEEHVQDFKNINLDKIIGAYCVINLEGGNSYVEIMNISQIKTAWSKGYGYKPGKGVHGDFADMMAKKTVTQRACRQIVQQYGDVFAAESYEKAEEAESVDIVAEDVGYDIAENANSEDFIVDDLEVPETVEEPKAEDSQKIESEVVADDDLPEFMK